MQKSNTVVEHRILCDKFELPSEQTDASPAGEVQGARSKDRSVGLSETDWVELKLQAKKGSS